MDGVEVPWDKLDSQVLRKVIEDFVMREGTDYGERVFTLDEKVADVLKGLKRREIQIWFDEESGTCNILKKSDGR